MAQRQQPNLQRVTTINADGSRDKLQPADVSGRFTVWRILVGYLLIGIVFALPWIDIGGYPAVFLNVDERRFHLFGLTFLAEDFWLLYFLITGLGFTLFYITALFGRIWCGWLCPHSVLLEQIFRRIERLIEGDSQARKQLAKAPLTSGKLAKLLTKHFSYVLVALAIAHVAIAYFVSIPQLYEWMQHSPMEHLGAFVFMGIFTVVLYVNFAWFREQLCLIICPYGRLQSALIDDNSLIIGYDEKRGEPRGKASDPNAGDCIACSRCVQVCPTGIDIRMGLQMECIGCANCIDACDEIMTKLKRPKGLIRYDSMRGFEGAGKKFIRPRTIVYTLLMCVGALAMTYAFSTVKPASIKALRIIGAPYYVTDSGIRNQYNVRVLNKTSETQTFTLKPSAPADLFSYTGFQDAVTLEPFEDVVRPLVITQTSREYDGNFELTLTLQNKDKSIEVSSPIEFIGPNPKLFKEHHPDALAQ